MSVTEKTYQEEACEVARKNIEAYMSKYQGRALEDARKTIDEQSKSAFEHEASPAELGWTVAMAVLGRHLIPIDGLDNLVPWDPRVRDKSA